MRAIDVGRKGNAGCAGIRAESTTVRSLKIGIARMAGSYGGRSAENRP